MKIRSILGVGAFALALGSVAGILGTREAPEEVDATSYPTTLYLDAGVWKADGAWFSVYLFTNGVGDTWVKGTNVSGDVYSFTLPATQYVNAIFCRNDRDKTVLGWDSKWNQSEDLTIPTDGKNLYSITGWDSGSWGTYDSGEETPVDYYICGNWNSWGSAVGNDEYKLTLLEEKQDGKDKYSISITDRAAGDEFKIVTGSTWLPANNVTLPKSGDYTIYFVPEGGVTGWEQGYVYLNCTRETEDPEISYYIIGDFTNNWDTTEALNYPLIKSAEQIESKDKYTIEIENLVAGEEFKVITSTSVWLPDGDNITIPTSGDYIITFVPDGGMTAEGWTRGLFYLNCYHEDITVYYAVGDFNSWTQDENSDLALMEEKKDGHDQYTIRLDGVEAGNKMKVTDGANWFPSGSGNDYEFDAAGSYNLYFCPDGGIEGWYEGYFYASRIITDFPAEDGYYLCGDAKFTLAADTAWKYAGATKMTTVESEEAGHDLAVLNDVAIPLGASVKARSWFSSTDTWYQNGKAQEGQVAYSFANMDADGNYVFAQAGTYDFVLDANGKLWILDSDPTKLTEEGYLYISSGTDKVAYIYSWADADLESGVRGATNAAWPGVKLTDYAPYLTFNEAGTLYRYAASNLYANFVVSLYEGEYDATTNPDPAKKTPDLESHAGRYVNPTLGNGATADTTLYGQAALAYDLVAAIAATPQDSVCELSDKTLLKGLKDRYNDLTQKGTFDLATLYTYNVKYSEHLPSGDEGHENIRLSAIMARVISMADGNSGAYNIAGVTDTGAMAMTITLVLVGSFAVISLLYVSRKRRLQK